MERDGGGDGGCPPLPTVSAASLHLQMLDARREATELSEMATREAAARGTKPVWDVSMLVDDDGEGDDAYEVAEEMPRAMIAEPD